jgi:hypothetical protein
LTIKLTNLGGGLRSIQDPFVNAALEFPGTPFPMTNAIPHRPDFPMTGFENKVPSILSIT